MNHGKDDPMNKNLFWAVLFGFLAFALAVPTLAAPKKKPKKKRPAKKHAPAAFKLPADAAVGNPKGAKQFPRNDLSHVKQLMRRQVKQGIIKRYDDKFTAYKEMTYKDLKVTAISLTPGQKGLWLQVTAPTAYRRIMGGHMLTAHIGRKGAKAFLLPEEFLGQPSMIGLVSHHKESTLTFRVSKPARLYAYINWDRDEHANKERDLWQPYQKDSRDAYSLFYRDFKAGKHSIKFFNDQFTGVGFSPLDKLSEKENIVVCGIMKNDKPVLRLQSMHSKPVTVQWSCAVMDPTDWKQVNRISKPITLKPKAVTVVPMDTAKTKDGIMYFFRSTVKLGKSVWNDETVWGSFPVPPKDASITGKIIPYGGYIKLDVSEDRDVYGRFLAATFYHFRKMKMNATMLASNSLRDLDVAHKYGIKCIIRMGGKGGRVKFAPDAVMKHLALLSYAIGDEPHISEIEGYIKGYKALTKKYPDLMPVTCTIFGGYATGSDIDPLLLHNHYLKDYPMIRFGRIYPFRKDQYGLTWPAEYKGMMTCAAIFQGIEANKEKPWWLVPPFFGARSRYLKPSPYWRIPTGEELNGLMHTALAHRCTGFIGWGTHTHAELPTPLFNGKTMAKTEHWQGDKLAIFGEKLMRAKNVILNFTAERIAVFKREPMEIEAAARWLKDGRFAIHLVNMDVKKAQPAEVLVFLGFVTTDRHYPVAGEAWFSEIDKLTDAFTGKEVAFEKHIVRKEGLKNYNVNIRIRVKSIAPGDAMMLVASPKDIKKGFTARPAAVKKAMADGDYVKVDF
jgi:hypothetical protein